MLVQDYHFALLPRMIRERLPRATIITFWHIPWPNPERSASARGATRSWRACWAARILGFHTQLPLQQLHRDRSTASSRRASSGSTRRVVLRGRRARWSALSDLDRVAEPMAGRERPLGADCRGERLAELGLPADAPARRRRRPPRLHQGHPGAAAARSSACSSGTRDWRGRFTFVQIAAPTPHGASSEYQQLNESIGRAWPSASTSASGRRLPAGHRARREHHEPTRCTATSAPPTSAA